MEIPRILKALHRPALMTHVDCNFFNSDEDVYNLRIYEAILCYDIIMDIGYDRNQYTMVLPAMI